MLSWFSGKSLKLLPPDVIFYSWNAPNSMSAEAPPQTPLEELTAALPRPPSWIKGNLLLRGRREGKGKGRGGIGDPLISPSYVIKWNKLLKLASADIWLMNMHAAGVDWRQSWLQNGKWCDQVDRIHTAGEHLLENCRRCYPPGE